MDKKYEELSETEVKVVEYGAIGYPKKLLNISNPPKRLYYCGELPDEEKPSIAIIGARNCSEYGRYMAEVIAEGLAREGIQIISGMALGIDGISQMCALNVGGKSYGILGSGVDICYPRANKMLYDRLKTEGGLISEYPNKTAAIAINFPYRNRIISGLCDGLVVVEAKEKSGTMITVDYALNQGKEIMVVPGRATDPLSVGCNSLIYQGAFPVQSAKDVMAVLNTIPNKHSENKASTTKSRMNISEITSKIESEKKFDLDTEEQAVYDVIDFYPLNIEEIAVKCKMSFMLIMSVLVRLEMKNAIKETGKNYYVRK